MVSSCGPRASSPLMSAQDARGPMSFLGSLRAEIRTASWFAALGEPLKVMLVAWSGLLRLTVRAFCAGVGLLYSSVIPTNMPGEQVFAARNCGPPKTTSRLGGPG